MSRATHEAGRRVLVTGANKGIGRAIVEAVLGEHDDTFVWLGSRDAKRGEAARTELVAAHPAWAERLEVLPLDVTDDASVKGAAERVRNQVAGEETPLYGLVNNAGIGVGNTDLRAVLEVNVLGMRRVCEAFVPMLDPARGRVVNVTSAAGPSFVARCSADQQRFLVDPTITWERLDAFIDDCLQTNGAQAFAEKGLANGEPYGLSKACANAYTLLVAREHPNLRVNACTPGFIATDLTKPYAERAGKPPEELGMKPPAAGTRSPMFLLFGDPEGNGRYYGSDALRSPLDRYRDPGTPAYTGD